MSTTSTPTVTFSTARRLGRPSLDRLVALNYYELGLLTEGTLEQADYGTGRQAVSHLAQETDASPRWLYMLRRLTQIWSPDEYRGLLDRGIPGGQLVLLAQVRQPDVRQRLVERLSKRPMSWRRLQDQICRRCGKET